LAVPPVAQRPPPAAQRPPPAAPLSKRGIQLEQLAAEGRVAERIELELFSTLIRLRP
jgi:hypothetical protein